MPNFITIEEVNGQCGDGDEPLPVLTLKAKEVKVSSSLLARGLSLHLYPDGRASKAARVKGENGENGENGCCNSPIPNDEDSIGVPNTPFTVKGQLSVETPETLRGETISVKVRCVITDGLGAPVLDTPPEESFPDITVPYDWEMSVDPEYELADGQFYSLSAHLLDSGGTPICHPFGGVRVHLMPVLVTAAKHHQPPGDQG